ncbi:flagellar hook-length control protein FliK [Gemmobacter denitrificans]|uniref:Flagellar hook-length control protein FliK n=1 Tax=Gemmobacter denitrificans TaxID=3123040 RepID=A0ABU8BVB6_9RHOB
MSNIPSLHSLIQSPVPTVGGSVQGISGDGTFASVLAGLAPAAGQEGKGASTLAPTGPNDATRGIDLQSEVTEVEEENLPSEVWDPILMAFHSKQGWSEVASGLTGARREFSEDVPSPDIGEMSAQASGGKPVTDLQSKSVLPSVGSEIAPSADWVENLPEGMRVTEPAHLAKSSLQLAVRSDFELLAGQMGTSSSPPNGADQGQGVQKQQWRGNGETAALPVGLGQVEGDRPETAKSALQAVAPISKSFPEQGPAAVPGQMPGSGAEKPSAAMSSLMWPQAALPQETIAKSAPAGPIQQSLTTSQEASSLHPAGADQHNEAWQQKTADGLQVQGGANTSGVSVRGPETAILAQVGGEVPIIHPQQQTVPKGQRVPLAPVDSGHSHTRSEPDFAGQMPVSRDVAPKDISGGASAGLISAPNVAATGQSSSMRPATAIAVPGTEQADQPTPQSVDRSAQANATVQVTNVRSSGRLSVPVPAAPAENSTEVTQPTRTHRIEQIDAVRHPLLPIDGEQVGRFVSGHPDHAASPQVPQLAATGMVQPSDMPFLAASAQRPSLAQTVPQDAEGLLSQRSDGAGQRLYIQTTTVEVQPVEGRHTSDQLSAPPRLEGPVSSPITEAPEISQPLRQSDQLGAIAASAMASQPQQTAMPTPSALMASKTASQPIANNLRSGADLPAEQDQPSPSIAQEEAAAPQHRQGSTADMVNAEVRHIDPLPSLAARLWFMGSTDSATTMMAAEAMPGAVPDLSSAQGMAQTSILSDPANPTALAQHAPRAIQQAFKGLATVVEAQPVSDATGQGLDLVLAPEELGRVRLTMIAEGDVMRVHLVADRPETLDLMRRHADQLANEFRSAGYRDAEMTFGQGSFAEDHRPRNTPLSSSGGGTALTNITPQASAGNISGSGLDLRL